MNEPKVILHFDKKGNVIGTEELNMENYKVPEEAIHLFCKLIAEEIYYEQQNGKLDLK